MGIANIIKELVFMKKIAHFSGYEKLYHLFEKFFIRHLNLFTCDIKMESRRYMAISRLDKTLQKLYPL